MSLRSHSVHMILLLLLLSSFALAQQDSNSSAQHPAFHNDVVIRGGTILTVTHGRIENGSIYVHDGKIAAIGKTVNAPSSAKVIEATGEWVMPGIID